MNPPRLEEKILYWLLPPPCRDQILGDLYERFQSADAAEALRQYRLDALLTLPCVIWSCARRVLDPRLVCAQTLAVYASLVAGAFLASGSSALGFGGACGLTVAAVVALGLADVYRMPGARPAWREIVPAYAGAAALLLANGMMHALPGAAIVYGGFLEMMAVATVRVGFQVFFGVAVEGSPSGGEAGADDPEPSPDSLEELRDAIRAFQRRIFWRNVRELAGGAVMIAISIWRLALGAPMPLRAAWVVAILCTAFVMLHLYRKGWMGNPPETADFDACVCYYRTALERQRDLLRSVGSWYLVPLAIAWLALAITGGIAAHRSPVQFALAAICAATTIYLVWKLNERGSQKLQRKIDGLNHAER